ncbi:MAG: DUF1573 domain-containing protein [Flavobacteriales bacterium]|nr:DUF1573 domain-containing protein [Flavobacteriales bacterium]MCB9168183.1 DUF1573 domain-containing protein [Flavobacteriales bacterium]MCB9194252.1 DUF1573 domain-containing protein [Flavobacteriales bacterium]
MFRERKCTIHKAWSVPLGAVILLLPSCRLTDHSEKAEHEVTTEAIEIPASGYRGTDPDKLPVFRWDTTTIDIGRISQGTRVERTYHFRNVGGSDLLIAEVRPSCGCTVSKDWPKHPIPPGDDGHITVEYDSEGRTGRQEKVITVVANTTPASTPLFLVGEVVAPGSEH